MISMEIFTSLIRRHQRGIVINVFVVEIIIQVAGSDSYL